MKKKGEEYTFKAMIKKQIVATYAEIVTATMNDIPSYLEHLQNIRDQFEYSAKVKSNLGTKTVVLRADFSENYSTKYHSEIQALHYGRHKI